jgi:hypothetical protein
MSEEYGEDQPWHLTQEPNAEPSYEELIDRIEELEAKLTWVLAERDETFSLMLDRAQTAEAKLAKAVEALDAFADCVDDGCYCSETQMATAMDHARTTLAELTKERSDEKGQDDE